MEPTAVTSPPPPPPCWSSIVQTKPAPKPEAPISNRVFADLKSSKGISVAVVDANAIIHGDKLIGVADKFVTVSEVSDEVRDPVSRQRLSFLPFHVDTMEPSPDSLKKVIKFARETGDLQTLSDVDLKLIALTYTLESQIHGTNHLRDSPPPLHVVNVKSLPEAQLPGWGNNVPNLAEWEALEQLADGGLNNESRILPLKDMDINGSSIEANVLNDEQQSFGRAKKCDFLKKEIKLDGKKMVVDGVDASQGEDAGNVGDWQPAVSRSTHRRYLRRKARNDASMPSEEEEREEDKEEREEDRPSDNAEMLEQDCEEGNISSVLEHLKLDPNFPKSMLQEEKAHSISGSDNQLSRGDGLDDMYVEGETDENDFCTGEADSLEISSQTDGSIATSLPDDVSSEQSWMLRSLSESSVACVTSDYAMQNVILQIGLRLLAPGGMQIRQLHRWVLKCHACNKVTQEIGRIFCPKCGNGGTLRKVSVTVGENGVVLAARRPRIFLRGTKFSLPMPQGGRDAITKNLILREDQLPHKLLYPKTKKKQNKQGQDFLCSDDIFTHSGDKRTPLQPPVRKALALFSGRRNPNDNHFSRSKH